jgi:Ca-activated chloride channel family protein
MKTLASLVLVLFMVATASSHDGTKPLIVGKVNCPYIPSIGGTLYLNISLTLPIVDRPSRKPMNLCVVLDRSGSMADERKIDYAKAALTTLIRQLSPRDILSVVIYDDVVEVLRPAANLRDREQLLGRINEVFPRGSTNLGGGLIEGLQQVSRNSGTEYVNRVILFSDGLANQGITDPHTLNSIVRRSRHQGISVTTMGVGLDYNENLMAGLAEHGGGRYYFIESPRSIAHILRREFDTMTAILAQNAVLEITLGPGFRVADVIGYTWEQTGNRCMIPLGDLAAGETQEITLELQAPEGKGRAEVAYGVLRFTSDVLALGQAGEFRTHVSYTQDQVLVDKNRDMEVQAKADVAVSTRTVEQALESFDRGDTDGAVRALEVAREAIAASPAAGVSGTGQILDEQQRRLEEFSKTLKDRNIDARKAKKSIQYENYKQQKNNN